MPDTKALFRTHFVCWRIIGMLPTQKYPLVYKCYSLLVNTLITVAFPLNLVIGFFTSTSTMHDIIENLAISFTSVVCTIKTFSIWWRFDDLKAIFEIIERQDKRLLSSEEKLYVQKVIQPSVTRVIYFFYFVCGIVAISSEISVLFNGLYRGNWRLLYQAAYYPFDYRASAVKYAIAHFYQSLGVMYTVIQNMVNDTFAASHLVLLGGQVHLLSIRLAKIGHDPNKSKKENNQELLNGIHDHKELTEYHRKLETVMAKYMFFQILCAGLNMCVVLVFIILFVDDVFTMAYYGSYLIGMVFQILPSCYYGTILEEELQDVPLALYSCNWVDQDIEFRQNLKIFIEQTWRRVYVTAWLFRVNNISFVIACKNAYSLFALIMNMR